MCEWPDLRMRLRLVSYARRRCYTYWVFLGPLHIRLRKRGMTVEGDVSPPGFTGTVTGLARSVYTGAMALCFLSIALCFAALVAMILWALIRVLI